MESRRELRRHRRRPYSGSIRVAWENPPGLCRYAQAKCLDISEGGLRVQSPVPIPIHTRVILRAEGMNLAGSASVRHMTRHGSKFILNLHLSEALPTEALPDASSTN